MRIKGKKLLLVAFSIALLPSLSSAQELSFSRSLSLGSTGKDVLILQKILNQYPETQIAVNGPGSPNNETEYFGSMTRAAVVRFQEKFSEEILYPAGLTQGTGLVGPSTRKKLNSLIVIPESSPVAEDNAKDNGSNSVTSNNFEAVTSGVLSPEDAFVMTENEQIGIFGLSNEKARVGDTITVSGFGFDQNTKLHLGGKTIPTAELSANSLKFTVPNMFFGNFKVWVSNDEADTKSSSSHYLTVGNTIDQRPNILSVSPNEALSGSTITISADELSRTGNIIYSSLGILGGLKSDDGKTTSFKVDSLPNAKTFFANQTTSRFMVTFSIKTDHGRSANYGFFYLNK